MTTTTIFDELRMATPDVAARRAILLDAAEHGDNLDPKHRDDLIERYADQDMNPVDRSHLFTSLITDVQNWEAAKNWRGDSAEEIDRVADEVWTLLEQLVPSPAVHTGPGTSIFDEPHADGAA